MKANEHSTKNLRKELLDDVYAGAFAGGMPAMLLEEEEIQKADDDELEEIAKRHGLE